ADQTHQKPPGMLPGGFDGDVAIGGLVPTAHTPDETGPDREPHVRGVGADLHHELPADAVRLDDTSHDEFHGGSSPPITDVCGRGQRSVSTTSTRTPSPPTAETIVRIAEAVRPPRPMTRPRSAGATATRITVPRRPPLDRTDTASGSDTIPRTRW